MTRRSGTERLALLVEVVDYTNDQNIEGPLDTQYYDVLTERLTAAAAPGVPSGSMAHEGVKEVVEYALRAASTNDPTTTAARVAAALEGVECPTCYGDIGIALRDDIRELGALCTCTPPAGTIPGARSTATRPSGRRPRTASDVFTTIPATTTDDALYGPGLTREDWTVVGHLGENRLKGVVVDVNDRSRLIAALIKGSIAANAAELDALPLGTVVYYTLQGERPQHLIAEHAIQGWVAPTTGDPLSPVTPCQVVHSPAPRTARV